MRARRGVFRISPGLFRPAYEFIEGYSLGITRRVSERGSAGPRAKKEELPYSVPAGASAESTPAAACCGGGRFPGAGVEEGYRAIVPRRSGLDVIFSEELAGLIWLRDLGFRRGEGVMDARRSKSSPEAGLRVS